MKSFLKRHFVPHEENDHRPHFLRHDAVVGVLLAVIIAEGLFVSSVFFVFKTSDFTASVLPKVLVAVTNEERISNSENVLKENKVLDRAAELKANDMATRGYFAHKTPEGQDPWIFLEKVGYKYSYAGENLAVNFLDSKDVVEAWMDSPTHRDNLLNRNYREIGIGTAEGEYEGRKTTFVVQFFAAPAATKATPASVAAGEPSSIPSTPTVAGAEISPLLSNPIAETAAKVPTPLSAPRHVMDYLLWFTAGFALMALLLAIFVKINIQHGDIIMNGVTIIFFALAVFAINYYFFKSPGAVPAEASGASVVRAF